MPTPKEKFNFTDAYQELEEINDWFQQEDIDLDKGLKRYRRGLELIKKCRGRLKEAEKQFHDIKKEFPIEKSKENKVAQNKNTEKNNDGVEKVNDKEIPF